MKPALLLPTYLPDILSVASMIQTNRLVLEIHDNYQKQSFRNRTKIATSNGTLTLTIPIKHVGKNQGRQKTSEALIENSFMWQRQHWRSLDIAYRTSPFFEYYEDDLKPLFNTPFDKLIDFNLKGLSIICEMLDVSLDYEMSQSYVKEPDILDLRFLADAKRKKWSAIPNYNQVFIDKNKFIPHLSILDLIFNLGPEAASYLETIDLNID